MNKPLFYKLVRFGINGLIMTIGGYALIQMFVSAGMGYVLSSLVGYAIMICINYFLSARFVFRSKKSVHGLLHFFASQLLAFVLFNVINYLLYSLGFEKAYCFFVSIIFSTIINFLYNNFITFRSKG